VIDVEALRDKLQSTNPPLLIDVREAWENELCQIPNSTLIPLGQLPNNLERLPKDAEIVVHCHHGGRSGRATIFLLEQGYRNVFNLTGGIHAWSERIDPTVKIYS
jgi:adenylyltransferase/sulfurtransferase